MVDKSDQALLKALAEDVYLLLAERKQGTPIKQSGQGPSRVYKSHTDGWLVDLGWLSPGKCRLQIWLDRFTRYDDRKIWYGFYYNRLAPIEQLSKNAQKSLGQAMKLGDADLEFVNYDSLLNKKLQKTNFGRPTVEIYNSSKSYYCGIYDFESLRLTAALRQQFTDRIVDFFETIVHSLPHTTPPSAERDIYPRCENRKTVGIHLQRESRSRSGYLATLRKQKDGYECQICKMRFEDLYGAVGRDFAEAHHIVPLSKIKGTTLTSIDDLITVCPNCHSMLHRLDGEQGDVQKLRGLYKKHSLKTRGRQKA